MTVTVAEAVRTPLDTLVPVQPSEIPRLWEHIEPYIAGANAYGGGKFASHDWLAKLINERAPGIPMAWLYVSPNLEAAAICEIQQYPRSRVFGVILLGGEGGHDWDNYQNLFEQQARYYQCDQIEIFGRPGWRDILKTQGYELAHHVWRKEI